jgi:hypothetical protein
MLQLAGFIPARAKTPQAEACATTNKTARPRMLQSVPPEETENEIAYLTLANMMAKV